LSLYYDVFISYRFKSINSIYGVNSMYSIYCIYGLTVFAVFI